MRSRAKKEKQRETVYIGEKYQVKDRMSINYVYNAMHDIKKMTCMKKVKQVVKKYTWNKASKRGKKNMKSKEKKENLLSNRKKKLVKHPMEKSLPKKNVH